MKDYFMHKSSYIEEGAQVGTGTRVWHFCHVMPNAHIGVHCNLGQNVFVDAGVTIGNHVKIQNNVSIYQNVTIEDEVFLGPSAVFTNVLNPRSRISRKHEFRATLVRKGATIGANATIVCGVVIGVYAFVGAGSVVTRDVPDFALVYGTPARIKGWMCVCGLELQFSTNHEHERAQCKTCGQEYRKNGNAVQALSKA